MYLKLLHKGECHILEDDIVTVYGTCTGPYAYESAMGGSITVPSAVAFCIDLKE